MGAAQTAKVLLRLGALRKDILGPVNGGVRPLDASP
jgi:hypothetical protein